VAPTSVKYPIAVSGMAKSVRSVATLNGAGMQSPTPPPTAYGQTARGRRQKVREIELISLH
jgi:hypothetical protein